MASVRVKICGITRVVDAVAAEQAGADAIGLIFVPDTPRHVETAQARAICEALGPFLVRVGVFRDAPLQMVVDTVAQLGLEAVQLHGRETSEYLAAVRRHASVIKARSFRPGLTADQLAAEGADAVLLDALRPGSGKTFDWSEAAAVRGFERLILAGGLRPDNVAAGVRAMRPYGVDVSTGVEARPGVKDPSLVAEFVRAARGAVAVSAS